MFCCVISSFENVFYFRYHQRLRYVSSHKCLCVSHKSHIAVANLLLLKFSIYRFKVFLFSFFQKEKIIFVINISNSSVTSIWCQPSTSPNLMSCRRCWCIIFTHERAHINRKCCRGSVELTFCLGRKDFSPLLLFIHPAVREFLYHRQQHRK